MFINKTLRLNNLKTRTARKISVLVVCVEVIVYVTLHNLQDLKQLLNNFIIAA